MLNIAGHEVVRPHYPEGRMDGHGPRKPGLLHYILQSVEILSGNDVPHSVVIWGDVMSAELQYLDSRSNSGSYVPACHAVTTPSVRGLWFSVVKIDWQSVIF